MGIAQSHNSCSNLDSSETSTCNTQSNFISRVVNYIWRKLSSFIPFLPRSKETQPKPFLSIRRPPNALTNNPSLHKNLLTSQPRSNCNHFVQDYPKLPNLYNVVYPSRREETKQPDRVAPSFQPNLYNVVYPFRREEAKKPDQVAPSFHDVTLSFSSTSVNQENKKSFHFIQGIGPDKISYTSVREVEAKKSSLCNQGGNPGKIPSISVREEAKKSSVLVHGTNLGKVSYTRVREEAKKSPVLVQGINSDKISYTSAREEAKKSLVLLHGVSLDKISYTNLRDGAKKSSAFTQKDCPNKIALLFGNDAKTLKKEQVINALDETRWIKHYSSHHRILLVGEGDFSFSACLAVTFGCASNMIATSLDSKEFLNENYKYAPSNIQKLRSRKCNVLHGIDATTMAQHDLLRHLTFDRIIYNFPFAGFFKDMPRKGQIQRHRTLVVMFLKSAKEMISENGEIHISHKTNGFHMDWNLEGLAYDQGLSLVESVKFNRSDYPGYHTKYGFGGDNDFNCNPSKTYKFGRKSAGY